MNELCCEMQYAMGWQMSFRKCTTGGGCQRTGPSAARSVTARRVAAAKITPLGAPL